MLFAGEFIEICNDQIDFSKNKRSSGFQNEMLSNYSFSNSSAGYSDSKPAGSMNYCFSGFKYIFRDNLEEISLVKKKTISYINLSFLKQLQIFRMRC